MKEKERIFAYDALKALAMFLVVFYHVGMLDLGYQEGVYYYPNLTQLIALFPAISVPLFFMVNGALTVRRDYGMKKTAVKAAHCVFIGYFWGVVMMCIKAIRDHTLSDFSLYNNYYWFMYTMAMLYIVNYLLNKLPQWCRWCVVIALLIYPFLNNQIWDFIALFGNHTGIYWKRTGLFTLYSVVYLYAGDYFAHHYSHKAKWYIIVAGLIGFGLLALEAVAVTNLLHQPFEGGSFCLPTIGALLLTIAVFVWGLKWNMKDGWLKRYVLFLANNSLGIYIIHMLIMAIIGAFFPQIIEMDLTLNPLIVAVISLIYMTVSACISEALRRSKLAFLLKL